LADGGLDGAIRDRKGRRYELGDKTPKRPPKPKKPKKPAD